VCRHIQLLSDIDFDFWKDRNPYFSDSDLNLSMKGGLTLIQDRNFLRGFNPRTAADIVDAIETRIEAFDIETADYNELACISDLIQAWGGMAGRAPYVKKKERRFRYDWKDYYDGVKNARDDKPVQAISLWLKIDGIGMSFASKHLRFWTKKYPVLDTRISLLLCGSKKLLNEPDCYDDFLKIIKPLTVKFSADSLEVEKALYAFSQHFFGNDKLAFTADGLHTEINYDIAEALTKLPPE